MRQGELIDGRYRLIRELGEGGFGAVWLAEEVQLRRHVAIKFLYEAFDRKTFVRFQRETQALARLTHDNILTLYATGQQGDTPYLVTEYVAGVTLSEWAQKPRSIDDVLDVVRQIAAALAAAHRAGVVHRDLKPANVIVSDGRVKVLDFGIAKVAGPEQYDVTKTGEVIGTPGFMSPEQLRAAQVGPPTDLYNLGVILWELLERRTMFDGTSPLERCMLHLTHEPPTLSQPVPTHVAKLVFRLLHKEPEARGRAVDVPHWLDDEQPPPRERDDQRPREVSATPPTGLALAVVGCVLVAGLVIWALGRLRPADPPPRRAAARAQSLVNPVEPPKIEAPTLAVDAGADGPVEAAGTLGCGAKWAPGQVVVSSPEVLQKTSIRLPRVDDRSIVAVPTSYDENRPTPLLLVLHDGGQSPDLMAQQAKRLQELGDKHRFIVVFGEGERLLTARTVLQALNPSTSGEIAMKGYPWPNEHVEYLPLLVELVSDAFCVDTSRLFLVGHGRGATGAVRLLTQTRRFAAAALTSYRSTPDEEERLSGNNVVPTLWIVPQHSKNLTDDGAVNDCRVDYTLVPFDTQKQELRDAYGCTGPSRPRRGNCETWACDTTLISCRADGGVNWPDYPHEPYHCEDRLTTYDYGGRIWKFFERVSEEP